MNDRDLIQVLDIQGGSIVVVDDEPVNVKLLERMLGGAGYRDVRSTQDPRQVLPLLTERTADLLLLDINMPYLDGYQVMEQLRAEFGRSLPPILVLTAQHAQQFRQRALDLGARDYVTKPFDVRELLARVRNLLEAELAHRYVRGQNEILEQKVQERTSELHETRLQVVRRLGRAAEYRDNETGLHIIRMSQYSALIGRSLGMAAPEVDLLLNASPMHDIGKIGIPDQILLKPGKFEPAEWEIMKTHTTIGAHILEGDDSELLRMAREIALTHHEKWDGSGYPNGLAGDSIPVTGRIVALADVFDALTSARPYKPAWSVERAVNFVREQAGRHFDPALTELFLDLLPEILAIRDRFAEPGTGAPGKPE